MPKQFSGAEASAGLHRRRLLRAAAATAAAALTAPWTSKVARSQLRFAANPFLLGVTSGDPLADGFVPWTRLAPDPLNGGGMPPEVVPVRWEVARDERFLDVVKRGETLAAPELGHSVHVDVAGLEPDRWYFYRFIAGGEASPIGRSRTFPPIGTPKERLRFAFASCQHFGQGYFTAYQAMMEDDLDLIVHLGDYIYESPGGPKVRFHLPEPMRLDQYRNLHALYKTDRNLQAAHAWHPFAVTWDDHEVDNDYAAQHSEDRMPVAEFLRRRAAAYQAYYEHMPLRATARPVGPDMSFYTTHAGEYRARTQTAGGRPCRFCTNRTVSVEPEPLHPIGLMTAAATSTGRWQSTASTVHSTRKGGAPQRWWPRRKAGLPLPSRSWFDTGHGPHDHPAQARR